MANKRILPDDQDWVDSFGNRVQRCTAKTKSSGKRCTNPAVKGYKVCRFHGSKSNDISGAHPDIWRPRRLRFCSKPSHPAKARPPSAT